MTVLHSRNADAADDAAAKDATDPEQARGQEATAEPDLREDLGRYAELGAFSLTADTHAWYAAVDTVATPEDARAASTSLAELRGRDLQQTWEAVTALAAEAKLEEPDTVAKAALLVELLQRVHRTSTVLVGAAYEADLDALAAATADGTWRRERGVKLSWLRARALRKQATALAAGPRRPSREDLHEALASAEVERRAWAVLASEGTLPVPPADGALVERTAQAFEAINSGLGGLARLLPDHDLDGLSFTDLIDLVDRLAADEGTLYRLPTLRTLRTTLEEAGLTELLTELAAAHADRRAAEAAYNARQALAGGQRDGLATAAETGTEPEAAAEVEAEAETEIKVEAEAGAEVATEAAAEAETDADTEAETDAAPATDEPAAELKAEPTAEEPAESQVRVVTLPAPSPAADDLVLPASATPAEPEPEAVVAEVPEAVESVVEPVAEVELAEPEAEAVAAEAAEPVVVEVAEVAGSAAEPVAEVVEPVAAEVAEVEAGASVDVVEAEPVVEAVVSEAVESVVEPVAEVELAEPEAVVAEVAEVAESTAEPVAEVESAEPEAVVTEVEAVVPEAVESVVEPVAEVELAEPEGVVAEVVEPVVAEVVEPVVAEVEAGASVDVVEAEPVVGVEAAESVVVAEVQAVAAEVVEPVVVEVAEVEAGASVDVVEAEPVVEPEAVEAEAVVPEAAEPAAEPVAEVESAAPAVEVEAEPAAAEPEPAATGRPAKPDFTPGRPVTAYSAEELLAVVRWLDGDGVDRSDEELLRAAMKELGFARLGPRIKEALGTAVAAARG
ncbi:hypothetical protein [Kitasatospora sp. NPDC088548]|uniref:hypothetical protein n=1 Tax=Kitasatospora sp. NPDC088548 TaxID=3364075 RepID=UPI00380D2D7F